MNALLYIIVAAFWGGSFIAIKPLVEVIPPMYAAALRIAIAVVFLTLMLPLMKTPLLIRTPIKKRIWLTGQFAFTVPFALLFWGEQRIAPGLAGILNGTVPLFVFALGAIFTPKAEAINTRRVVGLLFGILGLIVIFYPQIAASEGNSLLGTVAVTLMAVSYAVSTLMNRSIFTGNTEVHPFTNLFQQLLASLCVLGPLALLFNTWPTIDPKDYTMLATSTLYLGVGSTSIAFVLFYRLIKAWGAVRASTVTYVIPVAALFFDFIINHKAPSLSEAAGVLIVTAGVVILNWPANRIGTPKVIKQQNTK